MFCFVNFFCFYKIFDDQDSPKFTGRQDKGRGTRQRRILYFKYNRLILKSNLLLSLVFWIEIDILTIITPLYIYYFIYILMLVLKLIPSRTKQDMPGTLLYQRSM